MQVAAVGLLVDGALGAVLAVVAATLKHPPERPAARPEIGLAAVVLEADQRPGDAINFGLDHHVANVAPRARHGAHVKDACARQLLPVHGGVGVSKQLVTAAHREHDGAGLHGLADRLALLGHEVWRDHGLFTVLAAAKEDQITRSRSETVANADRLHIKLDAAPGTS